MNIFKKNVTVFVTGVWYTVDVITGKKNLGRPALS